MAWLLLLILACILATGALDLLQLVQLLDTSDRHPS
jgi:hypothetical protein